MSIAKLIWDVPEKNADLYYATSFSAHDDVVFVEYRGKKYLIPRPLELDRAKAEAKVDHVFYFSDYLEKAKKRGQKGWPGIIDTLLKELKIKKVVVPQNSAFVLVDYLRKKGYSVLPGTHPFYLERTIKTALEKKQMMEAQKMTFKAMAFAEKILRDATVKRGLLYWKGRILTSERLRFEIERFLLEHQFQAVAEPIVAGGKQGCVPHCIGYGPLKPHEAIVVDIFPRSSKTRFFGDATRTFCKGKASPELKRQYAAVKFAQEGAIQKIKAGVNGKTIHQWIQKYFETNGFPTKEIGGFQEGFIHGTGHGIGLEIHEEPTRIYPGDYILKPGHMVTVEPGLYYRKTGGVRIEDIVSITKKGCEVLSTYPKRLEIL